MLVAPSRVTCVGCTKSSRSSSGGNVAEDDDLPAVRLQPNDRHCLLFMSLSTTSSTFLGTCHFCDASSFARRSV